MNSEKRGIALTLCYIGLAGTSNIVLSTYLKRYDPFLITAICFIYANLYFLIVSFRSLPRVYSICKVYYRDLIALNAYTAGNWLAFYFSLSILDPIASITIIHVVGIICDNLSSKDIEKYIYTYIAAIVLLAIYSILPQLHNTFAIARVVSALLLSHVSGFCILKLQNCLSIPIR